MKLAVHFHGELRSVASQSEIPSLMDEILGGDPTYASATWMVLGSGEASNPISFLEFRANPDTGFGGVVWFAGDQDLGSVQNPTERKLRENFWVSESESPPDFDPDILSDPHVPSFFDSRGAIPIATLRDVVNEYCELFGGRPGGVKWVAGNQNGTRLD
ncbi:MULTISPECIES: Imm1 family immunity protein [Streptomyces]|uniref:Imm1 family immunity protein n=1 Tax=Streptomyces TaxID=1883 RepID=UPI00136171D6|nr:hypothetical protein [Streptomyces sp. SID724]